MIYGIVDNGSVERTQETATVLFAFSNASTIIYLQNSHVIYSKRIEILDEMNKFRVALSLSFTGFSIVCCSSCCCTSDFIAHMLTYLL